MSSLYMSIRVKLSYLILAGFMVHSAGFKSLVKGCLWWTKMHSNGGLITIETGLGLGPAVDWNSTFDTLSLSWKYIFSNDVRLFPAVEWQRDRGANQPTISTPRAWLCQCREAFWNPVTSSGLPSCFLYFLNKSSKAAKDNQWNSKSIKEKVRHAVYKGLSG